MFCLTVLYLDNFEIPIQYIQFSRSFKPVYDPFGHLASLKYGTEYELQRNVEKIQSLKHKMLHLGHFWVMMLLILTEMNAQIHNDNCMFSKRL